MLHSSAVMAKLYNIPFRVLKIVDPGSLEASHLCVNSLKREEHMRAQVRSWGKSVR
jgi:hypothetical protein